MPRKGYDEPAELYHYLCFSYGKLFTKSEAEVEMALRGRKKVEAMVSGGTKLPPEHPLRIEFAREGVFEIESALVSGIPAHKARVIQRIMEQHKSEIVVNRCPHCNCIVATPLAKQCLWCGHNWHQSGK